MPDRSDSSRVERIVGYDVDARAASECIEDILEWIRGGDRCRWLACINPHSYAVALDDLAFSTALRSADWLVPDGVGIVLASKLHGGRIRARITGWDVFVGVHRGMNARGGGRVFLLGGSERALAAIQARMAAEFPQVTVAGAYSPPFKDGYSPAEVDDMIERIRRSAADVLWVAMTAPKQEKWIHGNLGRLGVRFAGAVGAVFDFYGGQVMRSHPAFQRFGLEWLPRLVKEPRRLWRRTLISAPLFVGHVIRARVARSADGRVP